MTRVTLAYAYGDHKADETVDLDDDVARSLVWDGRARAADDDADLQLPPGSEAPFDPSEHNYDVVIAHLNAHPEDAERVQAAEADGRRRKSVLNWQPSAG